MKTSKEASLALIPDNALAIPNLYQELQMNPSYQAFLKREDGVLYGKLAYLPIIGGLMDFVAHNDRERRPATLFQKLTLLRTEVATKAALPFVPQPPATA